jgi:hypothetical protein
MFPFQVSFACICIADDDCPLYFAMVVLHDKMVANSKLKIVSKETQSMSQVEANES